MNRNLLSIALALAVAIIGLASVACQPSRDTNLNATLTTNRNPPVEPVDTASVEAELKKMSKEWADAYKTKDAATVRRIVADEVRKKLGSPRDKSDDQDLYVFDDKEMCQVIYDKATRKVTAISIDFMNGASSPITPQQVFGSDVESKPDGSKYKLVRYPKAGYWVSYSRTAGDSPMITVTIQKLQTAP
jgi:hypothetical protein